ncbi:MAG: class I adenylate cyclase [Methylococcaceae bacterium]|nr:class I adenylate cyclase [Methylococcaceae bacterium]
MTTFDSIRLGSPGEDISKKDLHKVMQRFINLNQARLQRIQEFLLPRQRIFLNLLPLLFHQNHPLLPGFVSLDTLAGIPNYTPSNSCLLLARSFSKNFTYKRHALKEYPIQGIYLMGSVSSIAFTKNSDIDIWLCHDHGLLKEDTSKLQTKATAIERWAESLDLEVHFFLVDSEEFIQGASSPLSSESSGKTQHYLLLDEFYRTSLFIAGRTPLWWLVPPHEEQNYNHYIKHLKENRFISNHEVIDFGSLEKIPTEEFISATLWHLYKSLSSPYKSLLKLLLMEIYASEYPNPQWLCLDIKKAVYQGNFNLDATDPYALIYHKVEKYLSTDSDSDRINFIRQCFYLKISGALEKQSSRQKHADQDTFIAKIVRHYQWPETIIASCTKDPAWNIKKASLENDIIIRQLKLCYRMISHFANVNASSVKHQDIQLVGRKLKSFLQKSPGKVDIITTRYSIRNKESELSLVESSSDSAYSMWSLFPGDMSSLTPKEVEPFKQNARSLIELLAWLVINCLYQQKLILHIQAKQLVFNKTDIHNTLESLRVFLSKHKLGNLTALSAFKQPNRVIANLVLLNLGYTDTSRKDGMLVMSEQSDIFSYGADRENFIHTIDQVSINNWGEVTTHRFLGLEGLFDCFIGSINQQSLPILTNIESYTPIRGKSIALGATQLLQKLNQLFIGKKSTESPRLIVAGESAFYIFQQKDDYLHYWKANNIAALLSDLAKPQTNFSAVHFNNSTLSSTPIPLLFSLAKEKTLQVFYYAGTHYINLYIIDEKGSFFNQRYTNTSSQQLLTAYSNFLATLNDKGLLRNSLAVEYFEVQRSTSHQYSARKITPPVALIWDYLNIRITGETYGSATEVLYTLYCNDLEFFAADTEEDIFKSVAKYIYNLRKNNEAYPIHITEIDVPLQALGVDSYQQLQSIHFLHYKQKIESRLNKS